MISKIAGQLTQDENFEEWWNSELIGIPYFQNKRLKIVFTEAENESYLTLADIALDSFMPPSLRTLKFAAGSRSLARTKRCPSYHTQSAQATAKIIIFITKR